MRLAAVLPLSFYSLDLALNCRRGTAADSLWMCQLANLLVGLGLAAGRSTWLRVGLLWLLVGFPFWAREAWLTPLSWTSYLCHLGGLGVALSVASAARPWRASWPAAWLFYLGIQELCRLVTPSALNVNLAHEMRDDAQLIFSAYWQYWLFTSLAVGALLFLTDSLLRRRLT